MARSLFTAFLAVILSSCTPAPANQKQGAISPNGKYVLHLRIEPQTTNAKFTGMRVWKVTITDRKGATLHKDDESTMVANLKIYWGWDDRDRVWVYNSDDGRIWRWEPVGDRWVKMEAKKSDGIPAYVLPDYAKK